MYEISVVSYQGVPPASPISAMFGPDGGTIGRGQANTLVLADPNRFVSRVQARLAFTGGRLTIANASTANPLLVNDRELEAGANAPLADGDELRVGLYLLRVRQLASSSSVKRPVDEMPSLAATAPVTQDPAGRVQALAARVSSAPRATANSSASTTGPVSPAPVGSVTKIAGPLDPLELPFGDASADPFADLMPRQPAGEPAQSSAADIAKSDSLAPLPPSASGPPPHPPSLTSHEGAMTSGGIDSLLADLGAEGEGAPVPAARTSDVPDRVWDDLARLVPTSAEPIPENPAPIPPTFDAFAAPSSTSRNAEDPLAEFAQSAIALESLDRLDVPVDKLFPESLTSPLDESILPDPNAAPPDPLAGQDTVDPIAIFDESSKARIPLEAQFSRSEPDHVPELEAFFRPPEARFERAGVADPITKDSLVPNPTEMISRPVVASGPAIAADAPRSEPVVPSPRATPAAISSTPPLQADSSAPLFSPRTPDAPPTAQRHAHSDDGPRDADSQASADAAFADRLLREFLAGAGIPNAGVKGGITPELMKRIGAMLATAVQGTIELIATRALLKREVKADVTIIATTRNNPLKFLPDAESALLQMFGSRIPGFMAPVEAMEDAFKDLRAHEVGVIAGMHAALAQVLKRFEPAELEKHLRPPGVLEGLLPNSHKARLWETFEEMYVDISREAQDDFQSLFGKAFLQAYEDEVARLKGQ